MALVRGWARIQTSKVFDTMEMTFSQWFPIWFRALPLRYRLLMYLNGLAVIYEALQALYLFWKKKTEPFRFGLLKISVLAGILYWVLSAPDVRFAWGFLAAFPVICIFSSATMIVLLYNKHRLQSFLPDNLNCPTVLCPLCRENRNIPPGLLPGTSKRCLRL